MKFREIYAILKTSVQGGINMSYTELEKEIFRKTFRELTFTPFIRPPVLYESSSENKLGREEYDDITDNSQYVNERKRYIRLISILLKEKDTEKSPLSKLIKSPKIYDTALNQARKNLYNYVAERLDFPSISSYAPSSKSLHKIETIGSNHPSYETVIEYYPQYCIESNEGVDFIEYILLLNISLTTKSSTLTMFEKLLKNPQDDIKINDWIARVRNSIYSQSTYLSYIDTFFSNFLYTTAKKYNDTIDLLQRFHAELEPFNTELDYLKYETANNIMSEIVILHNKVIPTSWRLFKCNNIYNPDRQKDIRLLELVDENTKTKAEAYVLEINAYINKAMEEAEKILPTLFTQ